MKTRTTQRLAIIGGGAAGLMAAIAAGDRARESGVPADITVFERDDRVGRSILATGNGRCNFSNAAIDVERYRNARFVSSAFDALGNPSFVLDSFEGLGLLWREESDGRLYPLANKASVVVDVLRAAAAELGVREACEREVAAVDPPREAEKPFTLRMSDGVFERADAVVLACGGRWSSSIGVEGLPFEPLSPVLGPLRVAKQDIPLVRELDNIRVRCAVDLARDGGAALQTIASERGELMFRKYGVSGICVFNLSRFAHRGDVLRICFLPDEVAGNASGYLAARHRSLSRRFGETVTFEQMLRGVLLPRVSEAVLKKGGFQPGSAFRKRDASRLAELLTRFPLVVEGIGDSDICQVRRGGFSPDAVDPATMQARACPGLFLAGEALDVDGPCGGYNLHWAWTSGAIAGRSAVELMSGAGFE